MSVKNAYPELPVIPYKKTTVQMPLVVAYIKTLNYTLEIKRTTYCIFRIESGNGSKGVNGNYCGIQADGAKLGGSFDVMVKATCIEPENMTKNPRRFACFSDFKPSIDYLAAKVAKRGLYIGGATNDEYSHVDHITDADSLDLAYVQEWVEGDKNAKPDHDELTTMESIYKSSQTAICIVGDECKPS
jgi:hypothetical protein